MNQGHRCDAGIVARLAAGGVGWDGATVEKGEVGSSLLL